MRKAICALLGIFCLSIGALTQTPQAGSTQKASFDQLLGEDDGAAFAILFTANQKGNIDTCDCNHPRGGLARRVGYVEGFRKKFKETPFLEVIPGFFLYNSTGYTPLAMFQNEQMIRALSRWPVDVINLGRFDLIYMQKLLATEGLAARTATYPIIKSIISANGVFGDDATAPPAYLIREISGPRTGGKKIRVGFVGVAEPIKPAEAIDITVTDIYAAAKRAIAEARKECDLLVVLAHSELQTATKIAEENPQADVVIAGNAATVLKPRQVGNTLILCAAPGNTQEGDLRVYINADGKFTFKFRSTDLDEIIPDDPQAAAFADTARQERYKFRFKR